LLEKEAYVIIKKYFLFTELVILCLIYHIMYDDCGLTMILIDKKKLFDILQKLFLSTIHEHFIALK